MSGKSKQDQPQVFDGPAFAKWLRKWMEAENLEVGDVASASGLSRGMITTLRRGMPTAAELSRGQANKITPALESLVGLAQGLDLDLSYLLSKAGLTSVGERWANFTPREREALAKALYAEQLDQHPLFLGEREDMQIPRLASSPNDMDDLLRALTHQNPGD